MSTDALGVIESTLRDAAKRINRYRRAHDPESDELDELAELIGEQADQVLMVAQPISVASEAPTGAQK